MLLRLLGDDLANSRHFAIIDLTQEKQGDVQILRLHPFDGTAGLGQLLLQRNGPVADGLANVDAYESAETGHRSSK